MNMKYEIKEKPITQMFFRTLNFTFKPFIQMFECS